MDFGNPQALWFFLIVPFFLVLHFRSFSDMGRYQRGLSLFLRLALICAIVLALADTRLIQRSDELAVFFLWDGSRSMGEGAEDSMLEYIEAATDTIDPERDSIGIIAFGRDALVETSLSSEVETMLSIESDVEPDFTNLSGALSLALASLPSDTGARIVLLTDGNENLGDAITSARIAANRGIEIDAIPFGEPSLGEVAADGLIIPRHVEEGEMYDVRAVIESQAETDAIVEVYENDEPIGSQQVHLIPGKNVFTFQRQHPQGGFYEYRVVVLAEGDTQGENNSVTDYTIVEGQPRVAYISGDPNEDPFMVQALQEEGIQAEFRDISGLPTSLIALAPYDVVFFSDVGAELLMPDTMRAYQSFVRDLGGGFAMVGGENSFGPGGYYRTIIEEVLPVSLDLTKKEYMPSIGIVLVVDKSGSMAMVDSGSAKIEIAKYACELVVELLDQTDQVGVVSFDFAGQWVVPLQELTDKRDILAMIGTMRAGGGTSVYAGMEAAYEALRYSDTRIRHMIVLSDGITAPADFEGLVNRMNNADITLTTVSIGSDANVQLMEDIADEGGGNHYFTNSIQAVPRIFTKETFLMSNRALVEEPFYPIPNMPSTITDGVNWDSAPPLLGYVSTEIKPRAIEALTTHKVDPLLAYWQYGLGRSLAFTSDAKAHWAAGWISWPGYDQLWTQTVRWLVGGEMAGNLVPNVYFRGGKAYISVDAIDVHGEMITDANIRANVVLPDTDLVELNLFQVAPGRYEASMDSTDIGSYQVNVFQEDSEGEVIDQVRSGFSVSYPPEYEASGPNLFLLSQLCDITGGTLAASPAEVFRHTNQPIARFFELWYYLLMAAIILLPLDIAVRRLSLTGESVAFVRDKVVNSVRNAILLRKFDRESPTHIDALKKIKQQYRLSADTEPQDEQELELEERIQKILAQGKPTSTVEPKPPGTPKRTRRIRKPQEPDDPGSLGRLLDAKKRLWEDDDKDEPS